MRSTCVLLSSLLVTASLLACQPATAPEEATSAPEAQATLSLAEVEAIPADAPTAAEEPPTPFRPPDLSHIKDGQERIKAQLAAFQQALEQTPDSDQKEAVLSQLVPAAERLVAEAARSLEEKPYRAQMKLDMARGLLPKEHALHSQIESLQAQLNGLPEKKALKGAKGSDNLADFLYRQGTKAIERERFDKAAWAFREAIKYEAGHAQAQAALEDLERRAKRFYEEAYVVKSQDPRLARKRLQQVIFMTGPDSPYHHKAQKLWRRLRGGAAPTSLGPRKTPAPADPASPAKAQGIALHRQRRLDEALAKYRQALKERPDDHDVYRLMGAAYALKGERKEAYKLYKQYVERCPACMHAPSVRKILQDYESWTH